MHSNMGPAFGESMRPGKASAQTTNMGAAEVTASEVASAKMASAKVTARVATAPMTTTSVAAAASSESSCWDCRAA